MIQSYFPTIYSRFTNTTKIWGFQYIYIWKRRKPRNYSQKSKQYCSKYYPTWPPPPWCKIFLLFDIACGVTFLLAMVSLYIYIYIYEYLTIYFLRDYSLFLIYLSLQWRIYICAINRINGCVHIIFFCEEILMENPASCILLLKYWWYLVLILWYCSW